VAALYHGRWAARHLGLIHLHLWDIAYRNVGTLDVLFLVQTALCLLAALTLLITRHLLVVLGAAALMAGTIVGFVLARSVGIFGFHLTFSSGLAWTVLIVEAAGVVMLLLEDNPSSGRGTA
jgi:hypothetical protein